jgi:hypothetical protein
MILRPSKRVASLHWMDPVPGLGSVEPRPSLSVELEDPMQEGLGLSSSILDNRIQPCSIA